MRSSKKKNVNLTKVSVWQEEGAHNDVKGESLTEKGLVFFFKRSNTFKTREWEKQFETMT